MSEPTSQPHKLGIFLFLFTGMTIAAIIAQSWWTIEQDRRVTLESEYQHGLVAVRLQEEHATQTLREAERNLDTVVNAILVAGKDTAISDKLIREVLTKAQPFNRVMKALQFVNPKGQAWVNSIDYPAYQTDADDRTYIPQLIAHPEEKKLVIGRPFQRFYDSEFVVPVARNVFDGDGKHLGIISTDISVSYFSSVYERVAKDSKAMVSLFTNEGVIIVRFPFNPDQLGQNLSNSRVIQSLKTLATEGMIEDSHFLDEDHDIARFYIYRKVSDYPVVSVFARDAQSVFAAWRVRSEKQSIFSAVTIVLICGLSLFLWRQFRRLHESERSLRATESYVKQSEIKFTQLFENSPVPLVLLRYTDHKILEINRSLLAQWRYSPEQVKGRTLAELNIWNDERDANRHTELLTKEDHVEQLEVVLQDKYGQTAVCQVSSRCFESNHEKLVIFSPIDISRLREVESQIRALNTQLEARVSERTVSLELANEELETALVSMKTMQKEMFQSEKMAALGYLVAGISHELNTPIGNSLMVASTIYDHNVSLLNEIESGQLRKSRMVSLIQDSKNGADILMRNLNRASQLITSFKQVAVDQSSDQRRTFDLKHNVEEILLTLDPMLRRTPFKLEVDLAESIAMESYPGAIAQIISNFVSNAITHGYDGKTEGTMVLSAKQINDKNVEITFSDDGNGIPAHDLPRVFDPFFTTKLGQGGSGLGLNIVYNLVSEVLGGSINLESELDVGTRISLILPTNAPLKHIE